MACRIATTRQTCSAHTIGAAFVAALIGITPVCAQNAAPSEAPPLSKACQAGGTVVTDESPLPNVSVALAKRKTLRILAMGAAPGHVGGHESAYTDLIESMLEQALKGVDVIIINRGVSGELAASAAARMKNEVALNRPDLVLWQVGTNDALAYVPSVEFTATIHDQIDWLKAHNVDVVLVGLQFAKEMLRDKHYAKIRDALRVLAAQKNVIVIRFYEAMQIVDQASAGGAQSVPQAFEQNEAGYSCLAQYVARAITLSVFGKNMPRRP